MMTGWMDEELLFAQHPRCYGLSSPVWHNPFLTKLLPIPGYEDNHLGDVVVGTPAPVVMARNLPPAPAPPPPRGAAPRAPPPWMTQVMKSLKELPPNPNRRFQPTIFRVPPNIRRFDPQSYTPQVISIGPYHRKEACLDRDITSSLQYYKRRCVNFLFSRERTEEEANSLLFKSLDWLKRRTSTVRSCYSVDDLEITDNELAELMLLDGCFIIRRLLRHHLRNPRSFHTTDGGGEEDNFAAQGPLLSMLWIWKFVDYDLLKLENQIPFFVLQDLFRLLGISEKLHVNLVDLALQHFSHIHPIKSKSFRTQSKYLHLLHLFYSSLHPSMQEDASERGIDVGASAPNYSSSLSIPHEWIPCAKELRRAGIAFKQNRRGDAFLDVTFKGGVLEIPSLRIDDYTNSIFRNLIAFEQCYPRTLTRITTYAVFMDCLIDTAHDVNLLESSGIVVNRLSTDDEVAHLFNNLTNQVHCVLDKSYLRPIIVAVNKYHHQKWPRYRAGLMRDYFNNPWAIISVIAASIVIIFTGLQTFYTVYDYLFPQNDH